MVVLRLGKDRTSAGAGDVLGAAVAIAVALVAAVAAFTIAAGVTNSLVAAAAIAIVCSAAVGASVWKHPIVAYDASAISRPLRVVSAVATIAALVQLARLAVFIIAPAQAAYSQFPSSNFETHHCCLTAYFVAGQALKTTPNVYDDALSSLPSDPTKPRIPRTLGPFNIDAYEYPPPFLLLPRALGLVAPDFMRLRMVWFGMCASVLLLVMMAIARSLGPVAGTRAVLLAPLVWAGFPMLNTLQKGNAQVLVVAIAVVAMLLFERRRWAPGGALLAYATVSKLYPGMLVVYLLARRQWRAAAWTAAFAAVIVLLSLLDTGWAPYAAFLEQLPRVLGGEAFAAFRKPGAVAINLSIPGIVFKLKLFGVAGMGFAAAKVVGWIYTLVVLGAIALVARRGVRAGEAPTVWLAIVILSTLRSPFLPQGYGAFPAVWLLTLLAAQRPPTPKNLLLLVLTWVCFNLYVPLDWVDPQYLALITVVPQMATIGVAFLALRRPAAVAATATELTPAAA
jgi:alpha-1,2-mannosyltransferase